MNGDGLHEVCREPGCGRRFDPTILVHRRREGDKVCVLVTDSGIPNLAEKRERKYRKHWDANAAKAAALRPEKPEPDPLRDPKPRAPRVLGQTRGRS